MNPEVDLYIEKLSTWQKEVKHLRQIMLDCQLLEEIKWRVPCYTFNGKNIALIGVFKDYCSLSFIKGVLLKDEYKLLALPGENSQSVKMFKFSTLKELIKYESVLKAYLFEAIEVEKAGIKLKPKKNSELKLVEELEARLKSDKIFNDAFSALSPGRQRGYNLYFSGAKQSKSRIARIDKYTERILRGKGIHDCVCGHSKRMPNCDGSHKFYE